PGALGAVAGLPVHGGGRVLHEDPRVTAGDAAGEVRGEGQLDLTAGVGGDQVVVVGDHVDVRGPGEVVHPLGRAGEHEVRGRGHVRGDLAQHRTQGAVVGQQLGAGGPGEGGLLGGVGVGGRGAGREDLLEGVVALRPERGAPGVVQRLDAAVAVLEPATEGRGGVVGEVVRDVAAQLVVH